MFPDAKGLRAVKVTAPTSIHRHSIVQNETMPKGNGYDARYDEIENLEDPPVNH